MRWRKAAAAVAASCTGVAILWVMGPARIASERLLGDTPEARVAAYLAAVGCGDRAAALGCWPSTPLVATQDERRAAHDARRHQVTEKLLGLSASPSHQVLQVEWWRNCWEPSQSAAPALAGAARLHVQITSARGETRRYTFDLVTYQTHRAAIRHVFERVYDGYEPAPWLDPHGFLYRRLVDANLIPAWRILDAYPAGEAPLLLPCPGPEGATSCCAPPANLARCLLEQQVVPLLGESGTTHIGPMRPVACPMRPVPTSRRLHPGRQLGVLDQVAFADSATAAPTPPELPMCGRFRAVRRAWGTRLATLQAHPSAWCTEAPFARA